MIDYKISNSVVFLTPVVTIFTKEGKLDHKGNIKVWEHLIQNGIDGIVLLGSTGEFFSISMEEKKELIDLIEQIKNFEGTEEEEDILLEKLQNLVLDPEISDYIYWTDMSSEEIADKVLAYKPIVLENK